MFSDKLNFGVMHYFITVGYLRRSKLQISFRNMENEANKLEYNHIALFLSDIQTLPDDLIKSVLKNVV